MSGRGSSPQITEWTLTPSASPGWRTTTRGATPACGAPFASNIVRRRSATCHARNSGGNGRESLRRAMESSSQAPDGVGRTAHAHAQRRVLLRDRRVDLVDVADGLFAQTALG